MTKISLNKIGYLLLLAVLLSGVFGFIGMNHAQMSCDPEMPNTTCPPMQWGEALHNISVYQSAMNATLSIFASTLLALAAFVVVFLGSLAFLFSSQDKLFVFYRRRSLEAYYFFKHKVHSWLSRFELSPSLA
ncbi:MAG TPA: hypothetical protein VFQ72_01040 [Candidatus Paceibacterota bacterium]|nr:hypothetical protein [Candidatus Paceibacterota bacterium]